MKRDDAVPPPPPAREVLISGLLVSLIVAAALVHLRFGSLDDPLASIAGALGGAIFILVGVAQLAARRLWPAPRQLSPLLLHAALVPWAAAVASAAAVLLGSTWAFAHVRDLALPSARCASFVELIAARWSRAPRDESAFVAELGDGRRIQFNLAAGEPACQVVSTSSRR